MMLDKYFTSSTITLESVNFKLSDFERSSKTVRSVHSEQTYDHTVHADHEQTYVQSVATM